MGTFLQDFGAVGDRPPDLQIVYKAVVQANLLFGTETWVMTQRIRRNLSGFHHRMACQMAVIQPENTRLWMQRHRQWD